MRWDPHNNVCKMQLDKANTNQSVLYDLYQKINKGFFKNIAFICVSQPKLVWSIILRLIHMFDYVDLLRLEMLLHYKTS